MILITNFAFGQDKVTIDKNLPKYEVKDEFNRFDDIANEIKHIESLNITFPSDSELEISNSYSSGFTGHDIIIRLNKNLNIQNVTYNYWTDVVGLNEPKYVVDKIYLKLNQNPFKDIKELRGQYILQINKIDSSGQLINTKEFKGKFKTFKGVDKNSTDYKWTLEQNKIFYGITNENGVYLHPDKRPSLKSDSKVLVKKLKELSNNFPAKLRTWVVINEQGKIEESSIQYQTKVNSDLEDEITKLLIEMTEWYPACVNDKAVKSKIPFIIGIE
ncbi:hypothetical protein [Bizionia psychrotolerans]|uniref:hypothetical protein n=1 Tax=Bizionia psychrotolerans TaxID=1492901 RepID=UPI0012E02BC9|nr:hypothetical protein [Bizionia psychrotolerans]